MRLTKEMRNSVIDSIVCKTINAKRDALIEEYRDVAQVVADSKYPLDVKNWMGSAPKHVKAIAFNKVSTAKLYYSTGGRVSHDFIDSGYRGVSLKSSVEVLADNNHSNDFILDKKSDTKIKGIIKKMDKLAEKRKATRDTITQALYSCTTSKQLIDRYPDLKEFIPADAGLSNLPVVQAIAVKKIVAEAKQAA